jgi:excisionase family DNA binding protein
MTKTESDETPLTMSVPEAGKKLGISRDSAYAAAGRGEIPTIRVGRLLRVPVLALERMLDVKPTAPSDAM